MPSEFNPRPVAEHLTDRRRQGADCNGAIWSPADALAIVRRAIAGEDRARKVAAWFWVLNRSCVDQPDPVELAVATLAYLGAHERAAAVRRIESAADEIRIGEAA